MWREVLCFYLILNLCGCQTTQTEPTYKPSLSTVWDGKIYIGDSKRLGVSRSPDSPVINCMDPFFNRMMCLTIEDYTALMQYFIQAACINQ